MNYHKKFQLEDEEHEVRQQMLKKNKNFSLAGMFNTLYSVLMLLIIRD